MARKSTAASAVNNDAQPPTTDTDDGRPQFDLASGSSKDFIRFIADLHRWFKDNPVEETKLPPNGRYDITPVMALDWLRRNLPASVAMAGTTGGNREVDLSTVRYYAAQMLAGEWQVTGQPVVFTTDGRLLDAQHRLLACLLSGASFTSYVVTDVEPRNRLFAYVDNGRVRSPAAALQTAGYNGRSTLVGQVCRLLDQYEHGAFTPTSVHQRPRLTPIQVLGIADQHPVITDATRLVAGEYQDAVNALLGYRDVVALAVVAITELHDADVCERFLEEVANADATDYNAKALNDPVVVLRAIMDVEKRKTKDMMRKHQAFGVLINTFNAWVSGQKVGNARKLAMTTNEPFPTLDPPDQEQQQEAAE